MGLRVLFETRTSIIPLVIDVYVRDNRVKYGPALHLYMYFFF